MVTEQNDIITLTWLPPFTLDIPSEDDDIRGYCVDVFNSTSNMLIYSECGISATLFQYPKPNDTVCHNYTFTVTPVNVVGNGTSNTIIYGVETSKLIRDIYWFAIAIMLHSMYRTAILFFSCFVIGRPEVDKLLVPRSQRKYEIKMVIIACLNKSNQSLHSLMRIMNPRLPVSQYVTGGEGVGEEYVPSLVKHSRRLTSKEGGWLFLPLNTALCQKKEAVIACFIQVHFIL